MIILLLEGTKSYDGLSKKGIAITVAIAAAITGSSFLIWSIPQSSPGTLIGPPNTDEGIISDVYSQSQSLALDVDSSLEEWKTERLSSDDMLAEITSAGAEINRMSTELSEADPAEEWQESYDLYIQALGSFNEYLNAMQIKVEEGDRTDDPELDSLRSDWEMNVNESVSAMPV